MKITKEIYSVVKNYASIIIMAIIAVADYIWGDRYFTCPCANRPLRIVFCVSFTLSPSIFLILADSNCSVLCVTCKNLLCDHFCRTWSAFIRPIVLATAWAIYSIMNPRFSECIEYERFNESNKTYNCNSDVQHAGSLKSTIAIIVLCTSFIAMVMKMLCGCRSAYKTQSEKTNQDRWTTKTMVALDEEDLSGDDILKKCNDSDFAKLENKITMGQLIILKEHCQKMNSASQDSGSAEGNAPANEQSMTSPPERSDELNAEGTPTTSQPASSSMTSPLEASGEVNTEGTPTTSQPIDSLDADVTTEFPDTPVDGNSSGSAGDAAACLPGGHRTFHVEYTIDLSRTPDSAAAARCALTRPSISHASSLTNIEMQPIAKTKTDQ